MKLDQTVRIPVLDSFRTVNEALIDLTKSFGQEEWHAPTVHRDRTVKDLTAHLLQTSLARVSGARDSYRPPSQEFPSASSLIVQIQRRNSDFMTAMRWVSPQVLIELLETYDREMINVFEKLDPDGPGVGVAWAGEAVSRNWFDIAREYTERWHHQQQLRDATGRPALYEEALLAPVLETFARGLPFALRAYPARNGSSALVTVTGPVELKWTLQHEHGTWSLWRGAIAEAETRIVIPADVAWRVWTTGMKPEDARAKMQVEGDETMANSVASFVAIMATRNSAA